MSALLSELRATWHSSEDPSEQQKRILSWATALTADTDAMLVDAHGLPVAVHASLPVDSVAATGAYVAAVLPLVQAMGFGSPQLVSTKLKSNWLTGMPLPEAALTLCLSSPRPVEPALYAATDLVDASWNQLLHWSLGAKQATSSFILDGRGLLVASSGDVSEMQAAEVGAHLTVAFERTGRMRPLGSAAESFSIQFADCWITGFHVRLSKPRSLTMAILGPEPVRGEARLAIRRALREQLKRGWPGRAEATSSPSSFAI